MIRNPFDEFFDSFFREFGNFDDFGNRFSNALSDGRSSGNLREYNRRRPFVDMWEDNNNVYLSLELPGVKKEDIDLRVGDNDVEVKIESKHEEKDGNKAYRSSFESYYRRFSLPTKVISDKVEAEFKNGILEVVIPKADKSGKTKVNIK